MKKTKKDTKKKKKMDPTIKKAIIFMIVIIIVIAIVGLLIYLVIGPSKKNNNQGEQKQNVKTIDGYGITVDDLDSELYHEEYEILKKNLLSKEIDYDEYAKSVAKLFIIDLYTLRTKINKYDIGGYEVVLPDMQENYKIKVMDTLNKYVEDNTKGERRQALPQVSKVTIDDVTEKTFTYIKNKDQDDEEEIDYDAYFFDMTWEFTSDLGYDTKGEVIVAIVEDRMYVVEFNT